MLKTEGLYHSHYDVSYETRSYFKTERNILGDMNNIPIPDFIKQGANEIYHNLSAGIKRNRQRKLMIYFCISKSYEYYKIPYLPSVIAAHVGIKMTEIHKSNNMFNKLLKISIDIEFMPKDYIPLLLSYIQLTEDHTQYIIKICQYVLSKDRSLMDEYPQDIAGAVILYYLDLIDVQLENQSNLVYKKVSGVSVNEQLYSTILGKSAERLKTLKNEICQVYNS